MLVSPTHGDIVFDAVFRTDHTVELEVTQHPVQYGASISDHSYFQPEQIGFQFGYSDVMSETGEMNHSVNAYAKLREIMAEREPLTVVTRLKQYENMLIVYLSVPDEVRQMNGLKGEIRLQQILIVEAAIVKVQTKITSSKSGTANKTTASNAESLSEIPYESELFRMTEGTWAESTFEGSGGKASTDYKAPVHNKGKTIKGT